MYSLFPKIIVTLTFCMYFKGHTKTVSQISFKIFIFLNKYLYIKFLYRKRNTKKNCATIFLMHFKMNAKNQIVSILRWSERLIFCIKLRRHIA